jgi:hypothetical protein
VVPFDTLSHEYLRNVREAAVEGQSIITVQAESGRRWKPRRGVSYRNWAAIPVVYSCMDMTFVMVKMSLGFVCYYLWVAIMKLFQKTSFQGASCKHQIALA